jgi:hypothetical protein
MTTQLHLVTRLIMRGAIPVLLYVFMAWCLVKHRDNFTFYLYLITPKGETVNSQNYCDVLRTTSKPAIRSKRRGKTSKGRHLVA